MSKTLAIFGAGDGIGTSIAYRFGREGYRVALVARRREKLQQLAAKLSASGIEVDVFPADLSATEKIPALVNAIKKRFGRIDVVEYAPTLLEPFIPARELDVAKLQSLSDLFLFTPVALVNNILPDMLARGDGAFLFASGASAMKGMPNMSGAGPAMAALRHYINSLHAELAAKNIYVGSLTIAALIKGTEGQHAVAAGDITFHNLPPGATIPEVDADVLADMYWDMYTQRDRVESFYPPR